MPKIAPTNGGHFDPVRARWMRKSAEPEQLDDEPVRFSEPITTQAAPATIAADWAAYIETRIQHCDPGRARELPRNRCSCVGGIVRSIGAFAESRVYRPSSAHSRPKSRKWKSCWKR